MRSPLWRGPGYVLIVLAILMARTFGAAAPPVPPPQAQPAPLTSVQMEINEVKALIDKYQQNERNLETALAATKGLIATNQETLAALQAEAGKK
jgi:septal ring factor EnvC (AmiA/AmiB activator)